MAPKVIVGTPFKIALAVFSAGGIAGTISYVSTRAESPAMPAETVAEAPKNGIVKGRKVDYKIKVKRVAEHDYQSGSLSCQQRDNNYATIHLEKISEQRKVKVSCKYISTEPPREVKQPISDQQEELVCARREDSEGFKLFECSIDKKVLSLDFSEINQGNLLITW